MTKSEYLIVINGRNNLRVAYISMDFNSKEYHINRTTWLWDGKKTVQPTISGSIGLSGRTVIQQAELIYNSHIKKYLDRGYKLISNLTKKSFNTLTKDDLLKLYGNFKTDSNNVPKPMLAISSENCASKIFDKEYYCSRKLDGVRCLMYFSNGKIHTASRGGKTYDAVTVHLRTDERLINFFKNNPDIILDGELYHHGVGLNIISGLAKLKNWDIKCNILEYWIYDYISNENFSDRYTNLMKWRKKYNFNNNIKIIDHYKLSGWLTIKNKHDQFVSEGYEGLVMRTLNKPYAIGQRSSLYMIKLKMYKDDEFKVIGWEQGLRPIEDMCFICETKQGKTFKAKPTGSKDIKELYIKNIDKLINKYGTVKYFDLSDDNIPIQPVFKSFRDIWE